MINLNRNVATEQARNSAPAKSAYTFANARLHLEDLGQARRLSKISRLMISINGSLAEQLPVVERARAGLLARQHSLD